MEKVQWTSIDKKQNELKYSKNDKSSTLPRSILISATHFWNKGRVIITVILLNNLDGYADRQDYSSEQP